jgi:hypothetical protein
MAHGSQLHTDDRSHRCIVFNDQDLQLVLSSHGMSPCLYATGCNHRSSRHTYKKCAWE